MSETGRIVEVSTVKLGDYAYVDHPAGATTLTVSSSVDFSEDGGQLVYADPTSGISYVLPYSSSDPDTDVIALTTPTATAIPEGTFVSTYPVGDEKVALVLVDGEDDTVSARIPHTLYDRLAEGVRAEGEQESCEIAADDGGEFMVTDIFGVVPKVDLTYADPTTIPPATVTPPAASPDIVSVTGLPSSLVVITQPISPADELEYHISTVEGFVPVAGDPATVAIPRTKSTVGTISLLPGTYTALSADTPYFVAVIARNSAGTAAPSPAVGGQLDPSAVEAVVAARLSAGFVLAGQVTVGTITITPDGGIVIPQPDGGVIRLPANGVDFAEITAHLVAKTLAVEGNMTFSGAAQVQAVMSLANGIVAPKSAPLLSSFWPSVKTALGYTLGDIYYGLSNAQKTTPEGGAAGVLSPDNLVACVAFYGSGIRLINRTTGAVSAPSTSTWSSLNPVGGITLIGSNYYVLGYDQDRDSKWYFYRLDRDFVKTGEWAWTSFSSLSGRPVIGRTDAGEVVVAYHPSSTKRLTVRTHAPSDLVTATATYTATGAQNPSGAEVAQQLVSVELGKQDRGGGAADRILVGVAGTKKVHAYSFSGGALTKDTNLDFSTAGSTPKGIVFDRADPLAGAGRYRMLCAVGNLFRFSSFATGTIVRATSTFVDLDAGGTGQHETAPSPLSPAYVLAARSWLRITAQPAPDAGNTNPALLDKANQVRIYAAVFPTAPGLQATPAVGTRVVELDALAAGAAAPVITTDFTAAGSSPGELVSVAADVDGPLVQLSGAGSWRLGDISGNTSGAVAWRGDTNGWVSVATPLTGAWGVRYQVKNGWVSLVVDGAGTTTSGSTLTIVAAGGLPAAILPSVNLRSGGAFSNHPGTIHVLTTGQVDAVQQSGANRAAVSSVMSWPLP